MKRLTLATLFFALIVGVMPAFAQANPDLILLNDATPAIDVVITLPPDTTGTISMDLAQAAVTLTDINGIAVFSVADARLHALELNIAPNSGTHTLTIERLVGATEAYVRVVSLPEMTMNGTVEWVTGETVTLNQEIALNLDANNPGGTATVTIPNGITGVVTATFPGAFANTQLVDSDGLVIAQSIGGHVDGLNFVLDGGRYDFTLLGSNLSRTVVAGVRAISSDKGGFMVVNAPITTPIAVDNTTETCTATVTASSVNLRTGPGTGYSVLGYAYRGETFVVGGQNPQSNWLVIAIEGGSAWMSLENTQLQGACTTLTVFDIPLQDAAPAQIIITSPQQTGGYKDDDEGEHASDERENGENEDD